MSGSIISSKMMSGTSSVAFAMASWPLPAKWSSYGSSVSRASKVSRPAGSSSTIKTIQLRHLNIHQNQIRLIFAYARNGLTPIAGYDQAAAFGLQIVTDRSDIAFIIFGEQNERRRDRLSGGPFSHPGRCRNMAGVKQGNARLPFGLPAQRHREATAFARLAFHGDAAAVHVD